MLTNYYTTIPIFLTRRELRIAMGFVSKTIYFAEQMHYFPQAEHNEDIKKKLAKEKLHMVPKREPSIFSIEKMLLTFLTPFSSHKDTITRSDCVFVA